MTLSAWMNSGVESDWEPVEEKWIDAGSHRVRYRTMGAGPDLVLLHGILGSADSWEQVLPYLATESTVYAVDAVGCGKSHRVKNIDVGLEAAAQQLLAFLNATGLERVDLLGTSHGGAVAMVLAARYPERVRNIILHAPANPYSRIADPLISFYRTSLGRWFARRMLTMPRRLQELALGRMYGTVSEAREGLIEKYLCWLRQPGAIDHQLAMVRNLFQDMKALARELPKLQRRSILLLWGTHDRAVSLKSGRILEKILENASLTLLPGAGHLPYEECPEEFAQAVNRFLGKQDRESMPRPFLVDTGPDSIPSAA